MHGNSVLVDNQLYCLYLNASLAMTFRGADTTSQLLERSLWHLFPVLQYIRACMGTCRHWLFSMCVCVGGKGRRYSLRESYKLQHVTELIIILYRWRGHASILAEKK
jgi:hypothetical protein